MRIDKTKLKAAREKVGMTAFDLAVAAGYKGAARIYQLENEGGNIHDAIGQNIAKALKCTIKELQ